MQVAIDRPDHAQVESSGEEERVEKSWVFDELEDAILDFVREGFKIDHDRHLAR